MEPFEIARVLETRQAVATAAVADESESIGGGSMCFSGPGSWTNQAAGLGFDGPLDEADLDRLEAFYADRGVAAKVVLCTYADEAFVKQLADRGFTVREIEHVFVRKATDTLPLPFGPPAGVRIEVLRPEDTHAFIDVSTVGSRPENEPVPDPLYRSIERFLKQPGVTAYLARADDKPVGGGFVEVVGETACLMGTAVLPEFRRRGIQQTLIACRVAQAHRQGARHVAIEGRPGIPTERNARRMGFQMCYVKLGLVR